jgi:hypothetical protein
MPVSIYDEDDSRSGFLLYQLSNELSSALSVLGVPPKLGVTNPSSIALIREFVASNGSICVIIDGQELFVDALVAGAARELSMQPFDRGYRGGIINTRQFHIIVWESEDQRGWRAVVGSALRLSSVESKRGELVTRTIRSTRVSGFLLNSACFSTADYRSAYLEALDEPDS